MSGVIVGGKHRYMLVFKNEDGQIGLNAITLHGISILVRSRTPFAMDMDAFEQHDGEIHMLVRGNVLVPELKLKVGDVEVGVA